MRTLSKNSSSTLLKSTQNLTKIMHEVLDRAKVHGATDAMVTINYESGFSVNIRMQEVETVAFNEDKSIGLTVYIGHCKGGASSTDMSEQALDTLVTAACDIAKVSAADPCFGLADPELMTKSYPDLDLYHPWDISPKAGISMAMECEKYALSLDKRISNSDGVALSTHNYCYGFANSQGGEGIIQSTCHSMSCCLIAKIQENMKRDYDYTTARNPNLLQDIESIAQRAVERTVARLGAKQIKTQKIPVLFDSRVASSLFGHFLSAISGSNLYRKNSFLLDAMGKQIFPTWLKISEQPYLLGQLGSAAFDDEGVPTRNNIFIENGILCQYALGSYSARRLGLKTTANSGGVHNLTIQASVNDVKDLLNKMDKGLLVTELMGQGVNNLTGDYSRGASGFWVEHGQLQYPVEEITIAGNLKDIFKRIIDVGADINPNIATRCGSVLIEEMTVAGY